MILTSPHKAKKFFQAKMDFTTGPMELNVVIQSNDPITIVDVRAAEDYKEGHIPEAVNLPKDTWDDQTALTADSVNVIYCYSEVCHLAAAAAVKFAEEGFPVMELEGGFDAWKSYNLPIET